MKVLYEVYIVKSDDFTTYNIINKDIYNKISLTVNDVLLYEKSDYTLSDEEVIFLKPLNPGDKIIIKDSISDNVKLISKNPYSKNCLFKLFTSDVKFKSNNTYKHILSLNGKEIENSFKTKYDPFYSSIEKIRMDTGDLLSKVTDSHIAKIIYLNSKEALETITTNEIDISEGIPKYVQNYVRYKTDIDFCYSIYLSITGKYGTATKKIGDIQIESTVKLPYLSEMLGRFKELLKINGDLMNGTDISLVKTFVKAQDTEYPVSSRGVF